MGEIINRINNEFNFNYDRYTRNNVNHAEKINSFDNNIHTSNNFKTFNEVEIMNFDDGTDLKGLIKDIKEFSEAQNKHAMTNTSTNPLENLSYKEYSQILESLDSSNLKTSDAALLFTKLDMSIDAADFSLEEKNSLLQKLDLTWNSYANKNSDNTLKYIEEAYINNWHQDKIASLDLTGVDVDRAIQDITNNVDDYDPSVLKSVASYSSEIKSLSETSKENIKTIEAKANSEVYR